MIGELGERGAIPFHQEDSCHEAMRDKDAYAGEVTVAKLSPQAVVEAADTIVCVRSTLTVGDAVEEMTIVGAFLPHAFHLNGA